MPDDPRLKAFLAEAATVVAGQGLTAEARQQLVLLAAQLRLTDAEWRECLDQLGQNAAGGLAPSRYELAFLELARKALEPLRGRILSLGREGRLLRAAARQHQLALIRAHQLLETVCEELDIRRISRTDAEAGFRSLAADMIESVRRVPARLQEQLVETGRAWGLHEADARGIVESVLSRRAQQRQRALRRAVMSVMAAGLAVWLGWCLWNGRWVPQARRGAEPDGSARQAEARPAGTMFAEPVLERPELLPRIRELVRNVESGELSAADGCCQLADLAIEGTVADARQIGSLVSAIAKADRQPQAVGAAVAGWWRKQGVLPGLFPAAPEELQRRLRLAGFSRGMLAAADEQGEAAGGGLFEGSPKVFRLWEPSALLQAWWDQLTSLPWPDPPPGPGDLLLLRQLSAGLMLPESIAAEHGRAVRRMLGVSVPDLRGLERELREAIGKSDAAERVAWLASWRELPEGPVRELLGRLLSGRDGGDGETLSAAQVTALLQAEWSRIPATGPVAEGWNSRADQSLALAELWFRERPNDPLAIAVVAQAVNDGLTGIAGNLRIPVGEMIWRFEAVGDAGERTSPTPEGLAARATASDLRTLEEVIAELEQRENEPRRGPYRSEALQRLLRIAPRLEDLPPPAAERLAGYCLADLELEEWLGVQRALPAFRFWPHFLMALSDGVAASRNSMDQGITIAQLCSEPGQVIEGDDGWREQTRRILRDAARDVLRARLSRAETAERVRWDEAARAVIRLHGMRDEVLGKLPGAVGRQRGGQSGTSREWASVIALAGGTTGEESLLDGTGGRSSLEDAVARAVLTGRELAAEWRRWSRDPGTRRRLAELEGELRREPAVDLRLGRQMLEAEYLLLQIVTACRQDSAEASGR